MEVKKSRKELNIEVKRDLQNYEIEFINKLSYSNSTVNVVKIYDSKRTNWNLILIQHESSKESYFVSIPKIENSCSPSVYGSIEHAEQYNEFVNLEN